MRAYREFLTPDLRGTVEVPLDGLRIGQQIARLKGLLEKSGCSLSSRVPEATMKAAIADQASGVEVQTGPGAPPQAVCPVCGDPYVALATAAVADVVLAVGEGDMLAILSLAFSPLVHLTLDQVGLSPEEVLERILDRDGARVVTEVAAGDDEWEVIEAIEMTPGPVFDIRTRRDGRERLYRSPWYVSLCRPVGPVQVRMLRLVLEQAEWVYVLGEREAWKQIKRRCMEEE